MCKENGCRIIPVFNVKGEAKGLYCSNHKKEGMVDVIHKTCLECNKLPSYNSYGESKALYCTTHKKNKMVNVIHKTCIDCNKLPSFNNKFGAVLLEYDGVKVAEPIFN